MQLIIVLFCGILSGCTDCKSTYDQSQTGEINVQVDLKDLGFIALLKGDREEYYEDIDYAYDYSEMTIRPQSGTSKKPLNVTTVADNVLDNSTIAATVYIDQTTEPIKNCTLEDSEKLDVTQHATIINEFTTAKISEVEMPTTIVNPLESNMIPTTSQPMIVTEFITTVKSDIKTTSSNSSYITQSVVMSQSTAANGDPATTLRNKVDITKSPLNSISSTQSVMLSQSTAANGDPTTTLRNKVNTTKSPLNSISSNSTICKKGFISNQRGGCDLKLQSMSNALLKIVKLSQKLKSKRQQRRFDPGTV